MLKSGASLGKAMRWQRAYMQPMARNPDLTKKVLGRTAAFVCALAVLIISPAGSPAYWQGWLYWAAFSASTLLTALYFLKYDPALAERRLHGGPTAETRRSQKLIQAFVAAGLVATFGFAGLDWRFGWSAVPAWLSIAADIVVVLGFAVIFATFKANTYASSTVITEPGQRVVSDGPYAVVRHPMYAGAVVALVATPIALASLWDLIFAALFVAGLIWRLLDEEEFLSANLAGYSDYCRRTRYRLIPLVW